MTEITGAITNTIPISMFNRGLAGKIFDDVKEAGAKVVMKNNTAECVLMSPDEYLELMEEVENARLLKTAIERMEGYDESTLIPADVLYNELGISTKDLESCSEMEVKIE